MQIMHKINNCFLVGFLAMTNIIYAADTDGSAVQPSTTQNNEQNTQTNNQQNQNTQKEPAPILAPNPEPDTPRTSKPTPPITDHLAPPDSVEGILTAGIKAAKTGDYKTAFKLFSQSCDEGNPAGCFAVGTMYMNGVGIRTDVQKATRYYEMGCSGGDATACANLAMIYDFQKKSDENNKEKAAQLYMTGCQGGDVLACNNLAWMYANGEGVQKDYFKAIQYYKYACEAGSDLGCYNLGLMSNTNTIYGIDKAKLGLVDLNYLACNAGDINGCANLGWMYTNGTSGAPVSYFYAAKYYQIACDGGLLSSCNNLAILYQKGLGVPQDTQRALDLFAFVCDNGLQSGCDNYRIFKQQLLSPQIRNKGTFFFPKNSDTSNRRIR
ncbi:tetratricopeptide repeat protein [Helicobacter sp. 13S00477-4]|uniref:tetratricopeptide repeat protein n=1 Tax=Helicobacter sp. 13S00477-4 TaxID=1905759 RepID=UPI0023B9917D|nr:tetratricopeptide repeat protein [Helicobacter sp. 13S00477-4]